MPNVEYIGGEFYNMVKMVSSNVQVFDMRSLGRACGYGDAISLVSSNILELHAESIKSFDRPINLISLREPATWFL